METIRKNYAIVGDLVVELIVGTNIKLDMLLALPLSNLE